MRQRYFLLLALFIVALPLRAPGTSIVARVTNSEIVVAADSKITRSSFMMPSETFCKIRKVGNHYVAVAGLVSDSGNGYALVDSIRASWNPAKTFWDNTRAVERDLGLTLHFELERLRRADPKTFDLQRRDQDAVQLLFFGFEERNPVVKFVRFVPVKNKVTPFWVSSDQSTCPGSGCPMGTGTFVLGLRSAIDSYLADHPKHWQGDTAARAAYLVQLEFDATEGVVGPPIDILRVDIKGGHWIQRKPQCTD